QLYRSAARTGGVQLFDEVETLRGDKDRFDALITVLNVGFERGGVVTRLEKRGERFVEEPYEVYAPRVLAGIAGLKDTLEDRAVDLWSPLLAVAFVADMEDGANRSRELLDAAKDLATAREADADSSPTALLLEALQAIREREGETVAPADLFEALRARPGWD